MAITSEEKKVTDLFAKTTPSVVSIGIRRTSAALIDGSGMRDVQSVGSGFVWDPEHIVTNFHVVSSLAGKPFVTFVSKDEKSKEDKKTSLEAVIIGADPASDVAVLYLTGEGPDPKNQSRLMRPLNRGTSSSLTVGQDVYALGNPFGLEHSMSRGIISGVSRTMEGVGGRPISGVIQTDASINPGNSGGPLLDSSGAVIGVNTAILSGSGTFAGVGLAVPIDTVQRNVGSIIEKGYVRRPFLGVVFAPDVLSEELSLNGIMVMKVVPGGPADVAGIRPMRGARLGDTVVAVDGKKVGSADDLYKILEQRGPGDDVLVKVQRASANPDSSDLENSEITVHLGVTNSNKMS